MKVNNLFVSWRVSLTLLQAFLSERRYVMICRMKLFLDSYEKKSCIVSDFSITWWIYSLLVWIRTFRKGISVQSFGSLNCWVWRFCSARFTSEVSNVHLWPDRCRKNRFSFRDLKNRRNLPIWESKRRTYLAVTHNIFGGVTEFIYKSSVPK